MQVTKEKYAIALRLYINHKRVLAKHSKWYLQAEQARSIAAVYSLMALVKSNCLTYNMQQLVKMVMINEKHLLTILPAPANSSYQTQYDKLQSILTVANNYQHEANT